METKSALAKKLANDPLKYKIEFIRRSVAGYKDATDSQILKDFPDLEKTDIVKSQGKLKHINGEITIDKGRVAQYNYFIQQSQKENAKTESKEDPELKTKTAAGKKIQEELTAKGNQERAAQKAAEGNRGISDVLFTEINKYRKAHPEYYKDWTNKEMAEMILSDPTVIAKAKAIKDAYPTTYNKSSVQGIITQEGDKFFNIAVQDMGLPEKQKKEFYQTVENLGEEASPHEAARHRSSKVNPYYSETLKSLAPQQWVGKYTDRALRETQEATIKVGEKIGSAISEAEINRKYANKGWGALTEEEKKILYQNNPSVAPKNWKPDATKSATGTKIATSKAAKPSTPKTDAEIEQAAKMYLSTREKSVTETPYFNAPGSMGGRSVREGMKEGGWSDADLDKVSSRIEILSSTPTATTQPQTSTKTTTYKSKTGAKVAATATAPPQTPPAPNPNTPGTTAQNPNSAPNTGANAPGAISKSPDPKGDPGDGKTTTNAQSGNAETKKDNLIGVGQGLAALQVGIGLIGADKYSKLAKSLIKNMPIGDIPLEAQRAYADAQIMKNKMRLRAEQGLGAAQKAEYEAKIEGTAAADLAGTAGSSLSRRLAVKSKYDALLGLASADEQVRSANEQKYLTSLEGANREAQNLSAIKRQVFEDRRKRWEVEYNRAIMGEQAGAALTNAGLTNLVQSIQLKELERMKKPTSVFNMNVPAANAPYEPSDLEKAAEEAKKAAEEAQKKKEVTE